MLTNLEKASVSPGRCLVYLVVWVDHEMVQRQCLVSEERATELLELSENDVIGNPSRANGCSTDPWFNEFTKCDEIPLECRNAPDH